MAERKRQLVDPLEVVDQDQEWQQPIRCAMGGLEDPDRVEGRDVDRFVQELAQTAARFVAHKGPEKLASRRKWDIPLWLIAHDVESVPDGNRGSGLVQQPGLAQPRFSDKEEGRWTSIDGDRPAEGANPVELRCATDKRLAHCFSTIRPSRIPQPKSHPLMHPVADSTGRARRQRSPGRRGRSPTRAWIPRR